MLTRFSEFRMKEVVNVADGCRIGYISDIEICLPEGQITALIVPGPFKWLGCICREADFVIPWRNIKRIGKDIILVEVEREKVRLPREKKFPF